MKWTKYDWPRPHERVEKHTNSLLTTLWETMDGKTQKVVWINNNQYCLRKLENSSALFDTTKDSNVCFIKQEDLSDKPPPIALLDDYDIVIALTEEAALKRCFQNVSSKLVHIKTHKYVMKTLDQIEKHKFNAKLKQTQLANIAADGLQPLQSAQLVRSYFLPCDAATKRNILENGFVSAFDTKTISRPGLVFFKSCIDGVKVWYEYKKTEANGKLKDRGTGGIVEKKEQSHLPEVSDLKGYEKFMKQKTQTSQEAQELQINCKSSVLKPELADDMEWEKKRIEMKRRYIEVKQKIPMSVVTELGVDGEIVQLLLCNVIVAGAKKVDDGKILVVTENDSVLPMYWIELGYV